LSDNPSKGKAEENNGEMKISVRIYLIPKLSRILATSFGRKARVELSTELERN
jgi:hypothetical protein